MRKSQHLLVSLAMAQATYYSRTTISPAAACGQFAVDPITNHASKSSVALGAELFVQCGEHLCEEWQEPSRAR